MVALELIAYHRQTRFVKQKAVAGDSRRNPWVKKTVDLQCILSDKSLEPRAQWVRTVCYFKLA
jgi:hypothetical protein